MVEIPILDAVTHRARVTVQIGTEDAPLDFAALPHAARI